MAGYTGTRYDVVSDWPIKGGHHNAYPLIESSAHELADQIEQQALSYGCKQPNVRVERSSEWERWKVLANGHKGGD